jgi:hypothetical protein
MTTDELVKYLVDNPNILDDAAKLMDENPFMGGYRIALSNRREVGANRGVVFKALLARCEKAERELEAVRALCVRKDEALRALKRHFDSWDDHKLTRWKNREALRADLVTVEQALALTPADLADCVCVKRSDLDGLIAAEDRPEDFEVLKRGTVAALRESERKLREALTTIVDGIDEDDSGLTLRTIQRYARSALAAIEQSGKPDPA